MQTPTEAEKAHSRWLREQHAARDRRLDLTDRALRLLSEAVLPHIEAERKREPKNGYVLWLHRQIVALLTLAEEPTDAGAPPSPALSYREALAAARGLQADVNAMCLGKEKKHDA